MCYFCFPDLHRHSGLAFSQRSTLIFISLNPRLTSSMGTRGLLGCLLLTALLSLSNAGLVKKILRHRRQTLASPEDHNITLPSADQAVVFNHVYNINVPASSLCSVDLDAPKSTQLYPKDAPVSPGHRITEHTVDRENQIVFTHRINIPRQACGCTEDLPGLKDLISRLEMLEGEVSALRDQCSGDGGCCSAQVTGSCRLSDIFLVITTSTVKLCLKIIKFFWICIEKCYTNNMTQVSVFTISYIVSFICWGVPWNFMWGCNFLCCTVETNNSSVHFE